MPQHVRTKSNKNMRDTVELVDEDRDTNAISPSSFGEQRRSISLYPCLPPLLVASCFSAEVVVFAPDCCSR